MVPDISSVTNIISKTAATNTVKVTVKDQFGTVLPYYTVKGTLSTSSRNYGATVATQVTDATGVATISLTDASTSTTNLSDVLTVDVYASGSGTSLVTQSSKNVVTITYSTTGTYASLTVTGGTTSSATVSILPLASDTDATNQVTLVNVLKDAAGASVTGVALTYTGSDGVLFRAASGTRTVGGDKNTLVAASGTSVYVVATKPGTATVTVTGGGLTATQSFTVKPSVRVRAITATASGNRVTGFAKDGFGNPVAGVTLSFATTSAGVFGSGVTSITAVTDATGSASAVVNSADGKAASATVSVTLSAAGTGNTDETAGLATSPVTEFAAGSATASVTATIPAAASATATTDAATTSKINDIATAVANLSTTVAGLVASLVAQIKDTKAAIADTKAALDKLAAVVAKIQKKVKA